MKRTMLLIASMMLALLVAAGVAPAQDGVSKVCNTSCSGTDGDDQLSGTANPNIMKGRNGEDKLNGGGNSDFVQGGIKSDYIGTGSGKDVVAAKDGFRDQIYCGSSFDRVYVDRIDVLHFCERKLSAKPQPQF